MEIDVTRSHEGKLDNYGIRQTPKGDLVAWISFDIDGAKYEWSGFLKGGATKYTLKTLIQCGLKDDLKLLALGRDFDVLDNDKVFSLQLAEEEYKNKTIYKVEWINELRPKITSDDLEKHEAWADISAQFSELLELEGVQKNQKTDDIPF